MNALLLRQQHVFPSVHAFFVRKSGRAYHLPSCNSYAEASRGENSVCPNFPKMERGFGCQNGCARWVFKTGGCCGVFRKGSLLRKGKPYFFFGGGVGTSSRKYLYRKNKSIQSQGFLQQRAYHFPISCLIFSIDILLPHFVIGIFGATN